jgi:hypothetical protein
MLDITPGACEQLQDIALEFIRQAHQFSKPRVFGRAWEQLLA